MSSSASRAVEILECAHHGPYQAARVDLGKLRLPPSRCPRCVAEGEAAEQAACRASEAALRRKMRIEQCGIQGRYLEASFATFKATTEPQRRAVGACAAFCDDFSPTAGQTLFLIGPTGTGKTHLISAIVRHVIEHHDRNALLLSGPALIRRVRSTWGNSQQTEEDVLDELGGVALLAIDEIGLTVPTESELRILFEVIDRRYANRRPTLMASNLNLVQLAELLGDRIFDRLSENHQVVVMNWVSHRCQAGG